MYRYAVGEPYNPAVTRWPETPHLRLFGFEGGGAELVLFFRDPTPREVDAFRTGRAEYALLTAPHVLALAYRFGDEGGDGIPWSDCTWAAARQTDPPAAALPAGGRMLVHHLLVDADTGIIVAQRQLTWPAPFADTVRAAVVEQLAARASVHVADAAVNELYRRYPHTDSLVNATTVRCVGGQG
jgi:hypothetical protein